MGSTNLSSYESLTLTQPFVSASLTANTAMPVRTLAVAPLNNDNTDTPNRKDLRPTFQRKVRGAVLLRRPARTPGWAKPMVSPSTENDLHRLTRTKSSRLK